MIYKPSENAVTVPLQHDQSVTFRNQEDYLIFAANVGSLAEFQELVTSAGLEKPSQAEYDLYRSMQYRFRLLGILKNMWADNPEAMRKGLLP